MLEAYYPDYEHSQTRARLETVIRWPGRTLEIFMRREDHSAPPMRATATLSKDGRIVVFRSLEGQQIHDMGRSDLKKRLYDYRE